MEDFERLALLLDFYGALLTKRQRMTFEDHICNDLSISEIAESQGISRQAAHDMIKRSTMILEDYEDKLHLVDKFQKIIRQVELIDETASLEGDESIRMAKIHELTGLILDEL